MNKEQRNSLRNMVIQCRRLLEKSVADSLQGHYGIHTSGEIEQADRLSHLSNEDKAYRQDMLAHLAHIQALGYKAKDALAQLVREIAFTHLNRLCAYKMMEARAVWIGGKPFREAVSRGMKSQGFQFYLADDAHQEDKNLFDTGHQDIAYRHFLAWLGATLSEEIGVLFSPTDPANRLFPPQRVLDDVLDLLNSDDLKDIWAEDETIGWVYQYFTPKELRDQVRKESAAPRNSYELAFRNQFFTPRYVVEFLTDNTLGRIWYEMRKGDTKLKDQCHYLIRRPSEIFLAEGQTPSEPPTPLEELSQEELLKQPGHIPHRPKKDPRELRILDPACGSGHFLLYCFDLLLTIYEEAYADADLGPKLKEEYKSLDTLRRDVPRLILAHNLHGIDIDLRASQIAALALWLRCQRAYRERNLKQDRPKITKSNIVCAEPMPGEKEMLKEFVAQLEPRVLGQLVEVVFDKMKLAGEAGSLLKIEEEIRETVAEAKRQFDIGGIQLQRTLFDKPTEQVVKIFSVKGITDEQFWDEAEGRVLAALRSYATHATNGGKLKKQLFAEDAERGFAFIDLCQKRFDIVLMNPPFGEPPKSLAELLESDYKLGKWDLSASFVLRALSLCCTGFIGAISTRIPLFTIVYEGWRRFALHSAGHLASFADLGGAVLDAAMVETAAYCISTTPCTHTTFIAAYQSDNPSSVLRQSSDWTVSKLSDFEAIPGFPLSYWLSPDILRIFAECDTYEPTHGVVKQGLGTTDDFRFCRLRFEVPAKLLDSLPLKSQAGTSLAWVPYVKGDNFAPYFDDCPVTVEWSHSGYEVKEYNRLRYGSASRHVVNEAFYGRQGLVFPRRTRRFVPRYYPQGMIFSVGGQSVFTDGDPLTVLGYMSTSVASHLVGAMLGRIDIDPQFEVGVIKRLPFPNLKEQEHVIRDNVEAIIRTIASVIRLDETTAGFSYPWLETKSTLAETIQGTIDYCSSAEKQIEQHHCAIESSVITTLALSQSCHESLLNDFSLQRDDFVLARQQGEQLRRIVSFLCGVLFGRWDVRSILPGYIEPFVYDPIGELPTLPPAMLGVSGELKSANPPSGYPLRIDSDGIIPDDPDHADDIIRRVRELLELIWKDRADAIEEETCEILGVRELRDYFRKPGKGGFWDDHVSRYSKSRRKAPIYWLLQSSKKNYGLWLYCHRLDKDMLFKARQNYVDPKIRLEQTRLDSLRSQKTALGADAKGAKKIDKEIERQEALLGELSDFAEKLERAAKLNFGDPTKLDSNVVYAPDLNDGVVLSIAPLWELVPWKEAKNYWEELLEGKYEWSSMGKLLRKKGLV